MCVHFPERIGAVLVPSWQDPNKPALNIPSPVARSRRELRRSRVSLLAVGAAFGALLGGCSATSDYQATLCTSALGEKASATCDGPKRPASLTMPRAELMRRVELPEEVTGSIQNEMPAAPAAAAVPQNATPEQRPSAVGRFFSALVAASEPAQEDGSGALPAEAKPADAKPAEAAAAPSAQGEKAPEAAPKDQKTADKPDDKAQPDAQPEEPKSGRKLREPRDATISLPSREERGGAREAQFSGPMREAILRAVGDHPLIGLAGARVSEALSSIGIAESALYPTVEGRLGAGHGGNGNYQDSTTRSYWGGSKNTAGAVRGEASLSGRQLLYDFGAVRNDIAKNSALFDSEALKLREQTEAVTGQVADIYLKILEQRELLVAASENVTALEKIVKLVEENEKNGNGTVADMKRVRSRLIDGQSAVADARSELQIGSDRFARLVHARPGTLQPVAFSQSLIPRTPEAVIRLAPQGNPRLQALDASLRAARHEIEAQKASVLPKLSLETDVGLKEYRAQKDRTEVDAKGLFVLKYKFLDGGLHSNQLEQLNARYMQAEMRMRSESDDIEADIRKNFRTLDVARSKAASLKDNVATSLRARQLYDEQFRGGKRTLLELLDIQTTYYTARRTAISNRFEEQRAIQGILNAMGRLTSAMLGHDAPRPMKSARR